MRGRRRANTQRSEPRRESGGATQKKLHRYYPISKSEPSLAERTSSSSSTASRKRKTESAELSSRSSPGAKRRQTSGSVEEMAPEFLPSTSDADGSQVTMEDDQFSVFTAEEDSDEHTAPFSDSESEGKEHSCDEYNEELENDAFRELEASLNDQKFQNKDAPPQLTAIRCTGIGSPKKVWGLLCRKNELIRPSHRLLDNHPELAPRTRAVLVDWMMEEIYPPKLEEFVAYTDGACTDHDAVKNDGEKHVVDQPFTVPDTLREDFMNMAKVLDLVLFDVASLRYSYRELAAAVLFACYEPHSLVEEVTGYSYADLLKVVEWVEPVVKVCERLRSLGDPLLIVEGVRADDLHNIQTHPEQDFEEIMADIEREREVAERARQKLPFARRRGPLRARCTNPDQITIFT
ncbi:hypothetical protein ANCCEY_04464 [Ancylostoma ceylanicum]|uniref:Uncharacterized protein n=1 Tax=Ancylostoma ceylanicum TaxID=53326 RepID=A0A0D6LWQ4_9BILA|nr:hypothetical protein ANCCEY_04464 [Ancylostoma ceylanicum]